MTKRQRTLPRPERVRTVEHPFGWPPCRILTNGTMKSMSPQERQLYFFLVLAADRRGSSFYGATRITHTLGFTSKELLRARDALIARDLLAFDGATYQLLPLPLAALEKARPTTNPQMTTTCSHNTIRRRNHSPQRQDMPESVRKTLRDMFGPEAF